MACKIVVRITVEASLHLSWQEGQREFEQKCTVHEQKLKGEKEQFEVSFG